MIRLSAAGPEGPRRIRPLVGACLPALAILLAALLVHGAGAADRPSAPPPAARWSGAAVDTLQFEEEESSDLELEEDPDTTRIAWAHEDEPIDEDDHPPHDWQSFPRTPYGEQILMDADEWVWRRGDTRAGGLRLDYNRVDQLRFGIAVQVDPQEGLMPRVGARLEYSDGRSRWLYGVQVEQPLAERGRFSIGGSMARLTEHGELQQTADWENSLALLFARQDYRDYFEREGFGAYLSSRLGELTTISAHLRQDRWRSVPLRTSTVSWFNTDVPLRENPAIDEGESRALIVRAERLTQRLLRPRAGLYHWISLETAGGQIGGDFEYTRWLADLRGVVRLSPATSFAMRAIAGSTVDGTLPRQRGFALGGADALRAHNTASIVGDQVALLQGEYALDLWMLRRGWYDGGLRILVFGEVGTAWTNGGRGWDVHRQHFKVDGGFGFATDDDHLRVYFAQNLQEPRPDFNVMVRLQRPF
jgi:hypothetical protein